jgi:hypothetical protein
VALLSCQQLPAGLDKDFGAQDDIGIVGIFVPVMADAANGRYEQHAGRHDRGQHLSIMTGAARHPNRFSCSEGCAGVFDGLLKSAIHQGRGAGPDALHFERAASFSTHLCGHVLQRLLQPDDDLGIVVANLEQHFGAAGDDAWSARIKRNTAGGPYRPGTA